MRILLINGPPRSGKDTLGDLILKHFNGRNEPTAQVYKFAHVLKDATHRLFDLDVPAEHFETLKDVELHDFGGLTPREAYIAVSERLFKPLLGKDYYGKALADRLGDERYDLAIVTDSGFAEEAQVLIDRFGKENVFLVHLYRDGKTFEGDSRSYIQLPLASEHVAEIQNSGTMAKLAELADYIVDWVETTAILDSMKKEDARLDDSEVRGEGHDL